MMFCERAPVEAFIGIGANLGEARQAVESALDALAQMPGVSQIKASSLWGSSPVDAGGPDYVNAVACIQTTVPAPFLLLQLQKLENAAGRERPYRNAPRTLDLDVLLYGSASIQSAPLTVPHPRMFERAFVLLPLAELAPQCVPESALQGIADQRLWRLA